MITEVRDKVNEKRKKVENLSTAMKSNSDPQALIKTIKKFNAMRQSWFQRKSMCIDAIDLLAEAMGKKAKEIMVSGFIFLITFLKVLYFFPLPERFIS